MNYEKLRKGYALLVDADTTLYQSGCVPDLSRVYLALISQRRFVAQLPEGTDARRIAQSNLELIESGLALRELGNQLIEEGRRG